MESMEPTEPTGAVEDNNLFVIDTQGDTAGHTVVESQEVPVKKLKRRNAAMYAQTD